MPFSPTTLACTAASRRLTVLRLGLDNDVALDNQALQTRTLTRQQRAQRERADPRRPEALERLCILAPSSNEDLERGRAVDVKPFEQVEHSVALVVNEEREGDDEALFVRLQIG